MSTLQETYQIKKRYNCSLPYPQRAYYFLRRRIDCLVVYHKNCFEYLYPKNSMFVPYIVDSNDLDKMKLKNYIYIVVGLLILIYVIVWSIFSNYETILWDLIFLWLVTVYVSGLFFYSSLNNFKIIKKIKSMKYDK